MKDINKPPHMQSFRLMRGKTGKTWAIETYLFFLQRNSMLDT